jgi:tetratricopeptide (TPR) repeat protein
MKNHFIGFIFIISFFCSCGNSGQEKPLNDTVKHSDSLSNINGLIRDDPGNLDLYIRRARILMNRMDRAGSLADVDRVISLDSNNVNYLLAAADINFYNYKVARTQQLLERAVKIEPDNVDCLLRLAELYHYKGNYEQELKLIELALQKEPRNAQAYFMKGMLFKEKGDTARAISNMQVAVEKDPDYYNAFIQLGLLSAAQKNPLAEQYYLNALKVSPNSEEALYNLGMYYQETENFPRAIDMYNTLLKVNPHHFDAHFNLGTIHTEFLKQYDDGIGYFNQAVEDDPKDPRGYYGRGWTYQEKGDLDMAETEYKRAIELDPEYGPAIYKLGQVDKLRKKR